VRLAAIEAIQLAAELLGAEVLERIRAAGHPDVRYSHGFVFQVLVPGPASIGELAVSAHRDGTDVGAPDLLARYDVQRRADVNSRTLAVDLLNRTLLSDFLPVQSVRGLGLYLIDRIGPLRRAVLREGVAPAAAQPRLMRGQAL